LPFLQEELDLTTQRKKRLKVHAVICEESWEEIAPGSTEKVTKTSRHAWLSDQPLHPRNMHSCQ
jgi:hypothetical protein